MIQAIGDNYILNFKVWSGLHAAGLLDGHTSRDRHAGGVQRRQQDRPPQRRLPQQTRNHPRPRIVTGREICRCTDHTGVISFKRLYWSQHGYNTCDDMRNMRAEYDGR